MWYDELVTNPLCSPFAQASGGEQESVCIMKILFVAAEVAPFVSVGGLSQVMHFLPKALGDLGHDIRVFTAKYGAMDETAPQKGWKLKTAYSQLAVPLDEDPSPAKSLICNVKSFTDEKTNVKTYFLENREYFELRANVFGYKDDHLRFSLLSKGALEWLYQLRQEEPNGWWPDVIHCHDWHTGYFIDLARRHERYQSMFKKTPLALTVHNFCFQGNFDFRYAHKEQFDFGESPLAPLMSVKLQEQNALKRGLLYADAVNTVSPTHSVEVLTPEYAEGLDDVLAKTKQKLTGILNGLDTQRFNPMTDTVIKRQYNVDSFVRAREENKKDLQKLFGLPVDTKRPLLAITGRLDKQKGWDLLLEALPQVLLERPDVQVVVLGTGEQRYRLELSVLQKTFSGQIGLHLRPDFRLPRKIFAGADMVIIPSIFEPGGIVALEALRYGCVPLVRRTGGLNDSITDFNPTTKQGNGFSFKHKNSWSLYGTIIEALTVYKYQRLWHMLVKNGMSSDFSWANAAQEYDLWYRRMQKEVLPEVSDVAVDFFHRSVQMQKIRE